MMMNSAVVMTTAASGFIRTKRIQWWGLGMIVLGGIFGVIVAATLVRNINVSIIRYGIVALSLWTAYSLWKESRKVLAIESAVENQ
ncbi:hypothetical protein [Weissella coleopterorum]|uniref:hypothetical protein n=1 Tax=Weissella coleopterorum TaxID=2714949 RepID=UPI001FE5A02B|nr:hypothetical protein [Weissella coleopterorum]